MKKIRNVSNTIVIVYIASIVFQAFSLFMSKTPDQSIQELLKIDLLYTIKFVNIFLSIISLLIFIKVKERFTLEIDNEIILLVGLLLIANLILQNVALIVGFVILMYLILSSKDINIKDLLKSVNVKAIRLELVLSILLIFLSIFVQFAYFKI